MRFRTNRTYGDEVQKAEGIFRILCLGDSMLYGQGLNRDETLPAWLERFLNRGAWNNDIEVINEGVCGHSTHDERVQFLLRGHLYNPDLIVLTLCDNDAELFGVQKNYTEHVDECWKADSIHQPYFKAVLGDLADHAAQLGIPLVVAFYYMFDNEIKLRAGQTIQQECSRLGLNFINLSENFVGELNSAYCVSPIDGHPSSQANQVAATSLARQILALGYFRDANTTLMPEGSVLTALFQHSENMRSIGYRQEFILHRLSRLLAEKRNSKSRLKLQDQDLVSDSDYRLLQSEVEQCAATHLSLLHWEAYGQILAMNREMFAVGCRSLGIQLQALGKKLFIAECNARNSSLSYLPYENVQISGELINETLEYVDAYVPQIEKLQTFRKLLAELTAKPSTLLRGFTNEHQFRIERIQSSILTSIYEAIMLLEGFQQQTNTFFALAKTASDKEQADIKEIQFLCGIADDLKRMKKEIDCWLAPLLLDKIEPPLLPPDSKPVTHIEIRLRATGESLLSLSVQADINLPDYPLLEDGCMAYCDGQIHTYHFEMPTFLLGRFTIRIDRPGDAELRDAGYEIIDIKLWQNPERKMSINPDELKQISTTSRQSPLIWVPVTCLDAGQQAPALALNSLFQQMDCAELTLPANRIEAEGGNSYVFRFKTKGAELFTHTTIYDQLHLQEDGQPSLKPAASLTEIKNTGSGRFAMKPGAIHFSTTDNSDPRTNGRRYSIMLPAYVYFLEQLPDESIAKLKL